MPRPKVSEFIHCFYYKVTNIILSDSGLSLQAMDSSHVALVSLTLGQNGFESYRADRAMTLGVSITNLAKVLKLASNDDKIILRAEEEASSLQIIFENRSKYLFKASC